LGKILAKLKRNSSKTDSIWENLIEFRQNQNLASSKTFDISSLLKYWEKSFWCSLEL